MPARLPDGERRLARTFKLPPALIARYEERAKTLGMDRTAFVEAALEAALGARQPSVPGVSAPSPRAPLPGAVDRADLFRAAQARRSRM